MGNCCGKASNDDNFQGEGRTLGAAPANPPPRPSQARAPAPKNNAPPQQGRTLGSSTDGSDPRSAAARAAEERSKATQGKGKLGKALDAQKSQTQSEALAQSARDNVAAREAQSAAERQNYD